MKQQSRSLRTRNTDTKTTSVMLGMMAIVLWLLYSLAVTIHQTSKIRSELTLIEDQNEVYATEIKEKERLLSYLSTTERITKEAKTQMGRKESGEKVIVFIEDDLNLIQRDEEVFSPARTVNRREMSMPEKWRHMFFGEAHVSS